MINETQLLAEMKATFPGIHARPLKEFGATGFTYGVWTGGEALMPDDWPIFTTLHANEPEYDGGVHRAFTAWLESRGWYLECYDYGTYMALPIALAEAA